MRIFWRRSLIVRAAMQVAGTAFVVGLCFVVLTVLLLEHGTKQNVSNRVRELIATVESTVQIACLTLDQSLATEVTNGLARNAEVFGVRVVCGGRVLANFRQSDSDDERIAHGEHARIVKDIVSPADHREIVGEIAVDPDHQIVTKRLRKLGGLLVSLLGLQLLAIVVATVVVMLIGIVRPIKRISDKLYAMDAESIEPLSIPPGQALTEIGRLATGINQLGQRLVTARDEEHRLHLQRETGERKYRAIFENVDSGIFVVKPDGQLESCNHAFYRQLDLLGQAGNDAVIHFLRLGWSHPELLSELLTRCVTTNQSVSDDFEYRTSQQEICWFNVAMTPVGESLVQGLLTDISRHKAAERFAQQEAVTDRLTGLLNRSGFMLQLDAEILACSDSNDCGFAVLSVDLDGFKRVNESMGLACGDQILLITANRLRSCLKTGDVIARLGNDSFGVILRSTFSEKQTASVAIRISLALKGFFEIGNTPLQLGASIGITLYPDDGGDRESLLRNAEMALDQARSRGCGLYSFFDSTMAKNAEHRRKLENDLRFAVRRNELVVHFQPIIDLSLGRMAGVEALIRWNHPVHGLMSPDQFIPLAEETGAIVNIGLWTVEAVCQQLAEWKKRGADYYASINISARQIPEGLPPITLVETVNRYGIDPAHLAIEITESVFMGNSEAAQRWLEAVHELGFRIFLDDFGTGYSSLSYIKRFRIDVLKIDKSFVRDMSEDKNDRALVDAIIHMADSLGLTAVAEGVESQRQLELLEQAGCRCVQGYFFSRPVPASDIKSAEQLIHRML